MKRKLTLRQYRKRLLEKHEKIVTRLHRLLEDEALWNHEWPVLSTLRKQEARLARDICNTALALSEGVK